MGFRKGADFNILKLKRILFCKRVISAIDSVKDGCSYCDITVFMPQDEHFLRHCLDMFKLDLMASGRSDCETTRSLATDLSITSL